MTSCAHRRLAPGRIAGDRGDNPRAFCEDCGSVLSLVEIRMTPEQRADVLARLEADREWVRGVRPGRTS